MKPYYMRLSEAAVIIPDEEGWGSQVLGRGSVVSYLPHVNKPSPITGKENERYVYWIDSGFKHHHGWLAVHTPWKRAANSHVMRAPFHRKDGLTAWDHIRAKVHGIDRTVVAPVLAPPVREWIVRNAEQHRAELVSVLREFGYKKAQAEKCSTQELTSRVLTNVLSRRYTMSNAAKDTETVTAADETTAKSASKKAKAGKKGGKAKSKKTAKETTAPAKKASTKEAGAAKKGATKKSAAKDTTTRADRITTPNEIGERTLALLKKAGVSDGQREAGLLAKGKKINVTSLTTLRTSINEAKGKANEKNNATLAADLNRMVRKVRTLLFDARASKGK